MIERQEFDRRAREIEALVNCLESTTDAALKATAQELVQALMDLHRAGLERALTLVRQAGEPGARLIDRFADDEVVKHLLVLHGLHPRNLQARVRQAIESSRSSLRSHGGDVESVEVDEKGTVHVTITVTGGTAGVCGSPTPTLRAIVEEAIYEAAGDLTSLVMDVRPESAVPAAFVAIGNVRRRNPDGSVTSPGSERSVVCP